MPVSLVDHLDRSPDKQILRGKVGNIHSWVPDEDEQSEILQGKTRGLSHVPQVVVVDFMTQDWQVGDLPR
eukprot:886984-Karenia_brevis.AAC.1